MPVRVRWPGARPSPPVVLFLPDVTPAGRVDRADDELCQELCRRAEMVVLCAPWTTESDGAPCAALERAALALEWCADHAGELGADPDTLVLAGRGSGAAAAVALARRAREQGWPRIARQLLIVPEPLPEDCAGRLHEAGAVVVEARDLASDEFLRALREGIE